MQTIIRTGEPRELLALVPFQLGFRPRESAVLVSIRARRDRVGLVVRVDLDALADPDRGPVVARGLASHLVADGAARVVVVLYSDRDLRGGEGRVARAALAHVTDACDVFVVDPPVCWVVGSTGWGELGCTDVACCPPAGRPPADLEAAAVSAEMVLRGATVAASRDELGDVGSAPADARRAARRARTRWRSRRGASPDELLRWRTDGLRSWTDLLAAARAPHEAARPAADPAAGGPAQGPAVAPTVLGRLAAALDDVLVRDAVLVGLVPGTEPDLGQRLLAGAGGDELDGALRALVDPASAVAPDEETCTTATTLLRAVAAHAGSRGHAPSLTLLAVLAWWQGDGPRAGVLVDRAVGADPEHRLAHLVAEALAHGMPPGWLAAGRG